MSFLTKISIDKVTSSIRVVTNDNNNHNSKPDQTYVYRIWGTIYSHTFYDIKRIVSTFNGTFDDIRHLQNIFTGEYFFELYSTAEYFAFADRAGRLPVYYENSNDGFKFSTKISNLTSKVKFNRLGVAQMLWCGFPLGEHTLYENAKRLPPGFIVHLYKSNGELRINSFNNNVGYDECGNSNESNISPLTLNNELVNTCSNIALNSGKPLLLSLSGGMDSRLVAAACKEANIPFQCVSFAINNTPSKKDAAIAALIARQLGIKHEIIEIKSPSVEEDELLIRCKEGQNPIAYSFIIPFLEKIKNKYGNEYLMLTGDGGDKVIQYNHLHLLHSSTNEVLKAIFKRYTICNPNEVAALCKLPKHAIEQFVETILKQYQTDGIRTLFGHFLFNEKVRKLIYEAEDRNREFIACTSPFFYLPFFKKAVFYPDELKKSGKLYTDMLNGFSQSLTKIPDTKGFAPNSRMFRIMKQTQEMMTSLPLPIKNTIKTCIDFQFNNQKLPESESFYIQNKMKHSTALNELFDEIELMNFISNINRFQYLHLKTVFKIDDYYQSNKTSY